MLKPDSWHIRLLFVEKKRWNKLFKINLKTKQNFSLKLYFRFFNIILVKILTLIKNGCLFRLKLEGGDFISKSVAMNSLGEGRAWSSCLGASLHFLIKSSESFVTLYLHLYHFSIVLQLSSSSFAHTVNLFFWSRHYFNTTKITFLL